MSENTPNPEQPQDQAPQPEKAEKAPKPEKGPKPEQGEKGKKQPKGEKGDKAPKGEKGEKGGKAKDAAPAVPPPPPRLKLKYQGPVSDALRAKFGVTNRLALPRLEKVVVTVGIGKQLEGTKLNPKAKEQTLKDLTVITGQKPVMCKAKKSVSNFKVRAGYEIGAMVTLRGARMWEFFDRLVAVAIPRIKDFRGLPTRGFDSHGNYTFGVAEQGLFPEVDMANAEFIHGMNITFVIKNSDKDRSSAFLTEMGMPFAKPETTTGGRAA